MSDDWDFLDALYDDSDAINGEFFIGRLFGEVPDDEDIEMISPRAIRRRHKHRRERISQLQTLKDVIKDAPSEGESVHLFSGSKFNFYTWIPQIIDWLGTGDELYCATWTANFESVKSLFELMDERKITGEVGFLLGEYFKKREPVVYTKLGEGLTSRRGWIRAFNTHCKILLLSNEEKGDFLTVEGSANLTGNPRLEQFVITNDRALYDWEKAFFYECKETKKKENLWN